MNIQKVKTSITGRMNKRERQQYIEKMDKDLSTLAYQDRFKYEFSKDFVNDLQLSKAEDGDQIQIGPLDKKILEYFIFTILVEFERVVGES